MPFLLTLFGPHSKRYNPFDHHFNTTRLLIQACFPQESNAVLGTSKL